MNRIKNIFSVLAFSAALLALPAIASAQWNGGGYGNPNGGYYPPNNGGYGNYNGDIKGTIDNLYDQARNFERAIDRGNSRYNDRSLRQLADQFVDATKDLKNNYGRGRDLSNSADEAQRVLSVASQIDNAVGYSGGYNNGGYGNGRNRGGYNNNYGLQGQWDQMRGSLQAIADTYNYGGYNNRGYRNNRGNNRGGQWRNRVPFPLPF